ncbi:MAG TPA: hypothetical protein VNB22_02065 [Pyrinomonadaceae bacterium]|jgi:hypothetical protein|nr:hypothetical protein [Pyrinomonadaceae bacterium]
MKYRSSIKITNTSQKAKTLFLEPWGEDYIMPSGKTFEFFAKAEREGNFEIEFSDNEITVYLWSGATVKVFCDGEELGAGNFERSSVPDVPEGQSVSSFLDSIFGKKNS